MQETHKSIAQKCLNAAYNGTMSFPEIVGSLIQNGFESYHVDFLRGSAMSNGGFSIIALPSTACNGNVSRIVPYLSEGSGVATTRADVNFVVTEYGKVDLKGLSLNQRASSSWAPKKGRA